MIEDIDAKKNELNDKLISSLKSILFIVLNTLLIIKVTGIRKPRTNGNKHNKYIKTLENLFVE
tara:strand:- start:14 stop:202 length:189 start_codon:yes stop_codon:yes gene_type:complete